MSTWRARIGQWLDPIARATPLSPNALTLTALAVCLGAAGCLTAAAEHPQLFLLAPLLALVGGLLDALDGVVARVKGLTSRWGDFLDHFADRVSDGAMLAGWLYGSGVRPLLAFPALLLILLVGYAGTQIEATFGQRSYDDTGRGEFVAAIFLLPLLSWYDARHGGGAISGLLLPEWATLLLMIVAIRALLQRIVRARRLALTDSV